MAWVLLRRAHAGAWDFSWDALLGRPAVVVNGEPISGSAAQEKLIISRRMVEREYGKEVFAGERGKSLLAVCGLSQNASGCAGHRLRLPCPGGHRAGGRKIVKSYTYQDGEVFEI